MLDRQAGQGSPSGVHEELPNHAGVGTRANPSRWPSLHVFPRSIRSTYVPLRGSGPLEPISVASDSAGGFSYLALSPAAATTRRRPKKKADGSSQLSSLSIRSVPCLALPCLASIACPDSGIALHLRKQEPRPALVKTQQPRQATGERPVDRMRLIGAHRNSLCHCWAVADKERPTPGSPGQGKHTFHRAGTCSSDTAFSVLARSCWSMTASALGWLATLYSRHPTALRRCWGRDTRLGPRSRAILLVPCSSMPSACAISSRESSTTGPSWPSPSCVLDRWDSNRAGEETRIGTSTSHVGSYPEAHGPTPFKDNPSGQGFNTANDSVVNALQPCCRLKRLSFPGSRVPTSI